MTKKELAEKQIELQEKIQRESSVNIVTCGHCGSVILHEMSDEVIECYSCKSEMDVCDCPDFWYHGMELTEFHEDKPTTSRITIEDVVKVATDLKMNPSISEMKEVLKYYDSEERENPDWNWSEIVENLLYNVVEPPHTK